MGIFHTTLFSCYFVTANAVLVCTKGGYGLEPHVRLANQWPFQIHLIHNLYICFSNCLLSVNFIIHFPFKSNWIYGNYESCFMASIYLLLNFIVLVTIRSWIISQVFCWLVVWREINDNTSMIPCINNISNFNQFYIINNR